MRQWGWLLGILGAFSAQAAVIEFDLTDLGGGRWQSDYTLINDDADPIEGFLIEFPAGLYANPNLRAQSPIGKLYSDPDTCRTQQLSIGSLHQSIPYTRHKGVSDLVRDSRSTWKCGQSHLL